MMRPPGPRMRMPMPMPVMRPRRYYGGGGGGFIGLIVVLFIFGIGFLLANPMIGILLVVGAAIFLAIKLSSNKNESATAKMEQTIQEQKEQETQKSAAMQTPKPAPQTPLPKSEREKEEDNLYTAIIKDQKKRMKTRLARLNKLIEANFSSSSITKDKYESALQSASKTFAANLDYVEEQIELYAEEGYYPTQSIQDKLQDNEEILEKLGRLSKELSQLESEDEGDLISSDLDDLIEQTKLYKSKNDEL